MHPRRLRFRSSLPYLLALVLPGLTTAFLVAPGGRLGVAGAWLAALLGIAIADEVLPRVSAPRAPDAPSLARLADLVALLQLVNFGLFVWRVSGWGVGLDAVVAVVLVGFGGAFSSMIAAHELLHRPRGVTRSIGRALLWTVLYDAFFIDHLRGHHRTVGTPEDALTARTDETFLAYLARAWPGELASAWRIERARGRTRTGLAALLRNDFVVGVAAEAAMLLAALALGGPIVAGLVVAQAALTHVLVAAVNFVEHWGIVRTRTKPGAADAWDADAPMSHYALLGLSFHADHHVRASRTFDRLELREGSPRLPRGYFTMAALVLFRSAQARRLLADAARRWRLDPTIQ